MLACFKDITRLSNFWTASSSKKKGFKRMQNFLSPCAVLSLLCSLECCIAASFLKCRIDKDSLLIAKKHLNFGCTEEEVNIVYSKLRQVKNMFFNVSESSKDAVSAAEDIMKGLLDTRMSQPVARCQQNVEVETEKRSDKQDFAEAQQLSQPEQAPKQEVEIQKFCRICEEESTTREKAQAGFRSCLLYSQNYSSEIGKTQEIR